MIIKVTLSEVMMDRYSGSISDNTIHVRLPNCADVNDLLKNLELSKPGQAVVVMDRKVQPPDRLLHDGDWVIILPVVEGG